MKQTTFDAYARSGPKSSGPSVAEINDQLKRARWIFNKTDQCVYAYADERPIMTPEGTHIKMHELSLNRNGTVVDLRCLPRGHRLKDGDDEKAIRQKLKRLYKDD